MKQILLFPLIAIVSIATGFAEDVFIGQSNEVSTEMLGLKNYMAEAAPPVGKVFVVRQEEWRNNKLKSTNEAIVYTAGEKVKLTVIYFDSGSFIFATPDMEKNRQVTFKTQINDVGSKHGTGFVYVEPVSTPGSWWYGFGAHGPRFNFKDAKGNTTVFDYSAFIEDYETAKKRNPTLPAIKLGETWGRTYNIPAPK